MAIAVPSGTAPTTVTTGTNNIVLPYGKGHHCKPNDPGSNDFLMLEHPTLIWFL
jgi:hypothetical protein